MIYACITSSDDASMHIVTISMQSLQATRSRRTRDNSFDKQKASLNRKQRLLDGNSLYSRYHELSLRAVHLERDFHHANVERKPALGEQAKELNNEFKLLLDECRPLAHPLLRRWWYVPTRSTCCSKSRKLTERYQ
eukprot:TRINITY_DN5589_c0_g2_i2.p1 TRINITY_DN5589_c0_g2~~TRINITY_DN5589_c0_g2_i2.p1  ORF type:complete len:136 (+),score=7.27 TRINITY_DN5589_c0_g2_i2:347-754(+)